MSETLSGSDAGVIMLRSDRLAVEIVSPGTEYQGTRFDWTGFITQVTLDSSGSTQPHTFCVPESLQPGQGTGGIGLCNEFGNDLAVGYADVRPGDLFPKLGIGLLRRPDEAAYNFFRPYEIAQPFPVEVDTAADRATFTVQPLDCRGYAVRLRKAITVHGNQVQIAYQLENVGRQPIVTNEYVHNFVGIDRHPMGPDYRLRLPYRIEIEMPSGVLGRMLPRFVRKLLPAAVLARVERILLRRMLGVLIIGDQEIGFRATPHQPFYCLLKGFARSERPQWELVHLPSGVAMRETDDRAPSRVAVWGTTHVISAEVFVDVHVQPGETQAWTRRYEFLAGPRLAQD